MATLAREDTDGKYVIVADPGMLQLDVIAKTLTLFATAAATNGPALYHAPITSCMLGMSFQDPLRVKLMVVPKMRGPCWLADMPRQASAEELARAMRSCIGDAHIVGDSIEGTDAQDADLEDELERLSLCQGFQSELQRVEAAVSRRKLFGF